LIDQATLAGTVATQFVSRQKGDLALARVSKKYS